MKKTNETGRSMVEMLGVIAIIGVLSIGGIAGYTMTMNKLQANEIVNALNQAAVQCRTRGTVPEDIRNQLGNYGIKSAEADIECTRSSGKIKWTWETDDDKKVDAAVQKAACKLLGLADDCTEFTPES